MPKIVYHGSPNGNIKELLAHKGTHQRNCIYGTENKVVALLFMGKGNGDLDTRISSKNGIIELVERRPNILKELYDRAGFMYELDGTTFNHYDYLWSQEVISFEKSLKPIKKNYYDNILNALNEEEKNGNIIIYRYPNRPKDIPMDNSDLIEKYIKFEKQGLKDSISMLISVYPEFSDAIKEMGYNVTD